jgi:hypothetical protein
MVLLDTMKPSRYAIKILLVIMDLSCTMSVPSTARQSMNYQRIMIQTSHILENSVQWFFKGKVFTVLCTELSVVVIFRATRCPFLFKRFSFGVPVGTSATCQNQSQPSFLIHDASQPITLMTVTSDTSDHAGEC